MSDRLYKVGCCVGQVVQWLGENYPALTLELSPSDAFSGPMLCIKDVWGHVGEAGSLACVHLGVMCDNYETVIAQFKRTMESWKKPKMKSKA